MKTKAIELIDGMFSNNQATGYRTEEPIPTLNSFNIRKFGEYFLKCTGKLNSTNLYYAQNNELQWVVGRTIGAKFTTYRKKSVFTNAGMVFKTLNANHVPLIKNEDKKLAVEEFLRFRDETIKRYDDTIATGMALLGTNAYVVTPVYNVTASSTYPLPNISLGHFLQDEKTISYQSKNISVKNEYPTLLQNISPTPRHRRDLTVYTSMYGYSVTVYSSDDTRLQRKLLYLNLAEKLYRSYNSDNPQNTFNVDNLMCRITGIDIPNQIKSMEKLYNDFVAWYDGQLEAMKEKYSFEFLMNSLDEEDCLI